MFNDTPEGQTHYENDGCGEPAHNKPQWEEKFDYEVGKLTNFNFTETIQESPVVRFGYKVKEGNTIWTITDFGNLKSFIAEQIREAAEREYANGYADGLQIMEGQLAKLQAQKEEILRGLPKRRLMRSVDCSCGSNPVCSACENMKEEEVGRIDGFNEALKVIRDLINKI